MRLFNRVIVERNSHKFWFVINVNNYDVYDDLEILERLVINST